MAASPRRDAATADLTEAFARYTGAHPHVTHRCVAFSGGRDSHVLLHVARQVLRDDPATTLRALHVDHGLSPDSARWAEHCRAVCDRLGVPLAVRRVEVVPGSDGPEAAARAARHEAFAAALGTGEHLLLAQHADDQAETFLLQALRGSGPDGLAAMPPSRPFARGTLARPLLDCAAEAIAAYAGRHALQWIDDPSNAEQRFDRNFLRHEILPRLRQRWPAAVRTLGRAARHSAAASGILHDVADEDLSALRLAGSDALCVSALRRLPRERGCNALRSWLRQASLRMPRLQDLTAVHDHLVLAGPGSAGRVRVGDHEFRRHGDRLYLLPAGGEACAFEHPWPAPHEPLLIPEIGLRLTREDCAARGLRLPAGGRVTVRSRVGGEVIASGRRGGGSGGGSGGETGPRPGFHRTLKQLLQEAGVPPWERGRIPLLFVDDRLVMVWGIAVASGAADPPRPV